MESYNIKTTKAKALSLAEQLFTYALMIAPWLVFVYLIYYYVL